MTASFAITADELTVGYGAQPIVGRLSFDLGPGALMCLIGTNGSGKSTLLKTIAGLIRPVEGAVEVLGAAPGTQPARVAYLAQRSPSSFTLPIRAADVVSMGRFAHLGLVRRTSAIDRGVCDEAMQRMGVTPFAHRPLLELSGGQQQRTYLAQVLARQADLLLLDEPTAGLDPAGRELIGTALAAERARGSAVVMATHDLADAEGADVVLLLAGRLIAIGAPAEVLTDEHLRASFGFTGRH
ncbi:MAG: metal ABC transporter ATP-binding protein [Ilumatobacteraceae bacterium]